MNRKTQRLLEKKLGVDFPFDKFLALLGYYSKTMQLDVNSFMVYLLKKYIPIHYEEVSLYYDFTEV